MTKKTTAEKSPSESPHVQRFRPVTYKEGSDRVYWIDKEGEMVPYVRVSTVLDETESNAGLVIWAGGLAPGESERIKEEAATQGTTIHKLIESHFTGCKIPEDMKPTEECYERLSDFIEWKKSFKTVEFVSSEKRVQSDDLQVAGRMDLMLKLDGVLTIPDIKTGKGIYDKAAVQIAAYAMMNAEMESSTPLIWENAYDNQDVPNGIQWPSLGVLHLPGNGAKYYEVDPVVIPELCQDFLMRLTIYRDKASRKAFRRIYPEVSGWIKGARE